MAALRAGARNAVNAITLTLQREITRTLNQHASNRTSLNGAAPAGGPPGKATGTLARSWGVDAVKDESGLADPIRPRMSLGSNLVYARIHEYGGTIHGRPLLTIPIHPAAKSASAQGLSARQAFPDADFIARKGKPPLIVRFIDGKKTRWEILYVLVPSVTLPARPYLAPSVAAVQPQAQAIADKHIAAALKAVAA